MSIKTCGYGILGIGMHAPEGIVTNADLEKIMETNDEWIRTRTGIRERRKLGPNEATSDMAVRAAEAALADSGVDRNEIELIICCTFSPDTTVPCASCIIQDRLGLAGKTAAFDLNAACTGFTYGASVAAAFQRAGVYKKALVIGADAVTRSLDYSDRGTAILFGDGAGAAVMGPTGESRGLVGEYLSADGSQGPALAIFDSGSKIRTPEEKKTQGEHIFMDGQAIFKFATRALGDALEKALEAAGQGLTLDDIDLFFPHQANLRIIEAAARRVGIPMEKVFVNIDRYGNTSAASVPMALAEASAEGRLKKGDVIGIVAFGGGLTFGASIWVW